VLVAKSIAALDQSGLQQLVVAGGVGANRRLRDELSGHAARHGYSVFYPELEFCTDNGAMIAFAGALRLTHGVHRSSGFTVRARWDLDELTEPA
jgi:N6-L-threonylcarbamoyladenine synthase